MNDKVNERSALLQPPETGEACESYASLRRLSSNALPPFHEDYPSPEEPSSALAIWTVIPVLLLGVFVSNADGSFLIASGQKIASDFSSLSSASWLITSYVLAQCASQPLYGKLSDIFGRRANLVVAYIFFAAGCFICGIGQAFWHVLAGRAISGIGGAGMTALVSIIIADMVPVRDVAAWRSYVNIAATVGRSLGGPAGGWLTDTVGWRWSFYGQCPLILVGLALILWRIPSKTSTTDEIEEDVPLSQKLKRVDIAGALTLASAISAFLLTLDSASREAPLWQILSPALTTISLAALFYIVERHLAKEPILPIELITNRAALTSYLTVGFQMAAQFGLFYAVPIYFQIASGMTVSAAGLRLVPAVIGNATGGLLSGYLISRTGRYKLLTVTASATASLGYLLVTLRWTGHIKWFEQFYVFLGGFGMGIIQSTLFIHLAASLEAAEMAIAGTTLYLAQNLFLLVGIQLSTAVLRAKLRAGLNAGLEGTKHKKEIIELAVSSISSIRGLAPKIRAVVICTYVDSLRYTYALSLVFAMTGLIIGLTMRERRF